MKSQIIIIYSLFSAVTITLQLGNGKVNSPKNKWFEDDNGRFKWSSGCSFPSESILSSDDVDKIKMNLFSSCPENCYKHNRCTHFVYTKGHCHLKELKTVDASPEAAVPDNPGGYCGFLVQRPDVVKDWNIGENYRTRWTSGCDYPNRKFNIIDQEKLILDRSKCGDYCLSIKRCTHFTSARFGYCWVKDMHGASVVQTVDKSTPLCGFIPERLFADAQRRAKSTPVSSDKRQSRVNNTSPQPSNG